MAFKNFLFILSIFSVAQVHAQSISGRVQDDNGTPVGYASLILTQYTSNDSVRTAGVSANELGQFTFKEVQVGRYRIKVVILGFNDTTTPEFWVPADTDLVLPAILLTPSAALKEVVVSSRKPLIAYQIDKTVINVEGANLSEGYTAFEILQRSPGVIVTPMEQINLAGKGRANVLIDGKSMQLNDTELAAYLKSLPSDAIKSIELIANPSAKYDAEGTAGIINIRLRKNQNLGFKGSANLGYSQSIHHRLNGGLNLNYRPGKINYFFNGNVYDAGQSVEQSVDRQQNGRFFTQSNPTVAKWNSQFAKGGLDYFINDLHTIGAVFTGSHYNHTTRGYSAAHFGNEITGVADSAFSAESLNPEYNQRTNYNLNYRFADTLGAELTVSLDRINYAAGSDNTIQNQFFGPDFNIASRYNTKTDLQQSININAVQSDFSKNWKTGLKLEIGAKATFSNTSNLTNGSSDFGDGYQADPGRTNDFSLQENIGAVYTNIGRSKGKWGWQGGLRSEYTAIEGLSVDLFGNPSTNPDTAYLSLFPSFFVQYNASTDHQWSLSGRRRLERPAYQDLNPFIWQVDPYVSERGNPYLRPAFSQSAELKYTYKYAASIAVSYTRTSGIIQTIVRTAGDAVWLQPANISTAENFSFQINTPLPIAKWWEGYCWLGVWRNHFYSDIDGVTLQTKAWGGGFWTGQQIQLGNGFEANFNAWAQFPTTEGQFKNKGIFSLDLGIKKSILKEKATISVTCSDVLGTQRWVEKVNFGELQATRRNDWESQAVAVKLNWRFGNDQLKTRERNTADAENRIKKGKNQ